MNTLERARPAGGLVRESRAARTQLRLAAGLGVAMAATVIAVPMPMTNVEAMPASNNPCASAKTSTMIAPEQGRSPTATMAVSPRRQPPGPASSLGSGPCECPQCSS